MKSALLLITLSVIAFGAQDVNPPIQFPAWILFCPGTETGIIDGCQYLKLDRSSFKFNPDHSLSVVSNRQYGVKLAWSGAGVTGLPANAVNVAMVANGIRIFADQCWAQDQSGLVTFAPACTGPLLFGIPILIDSTWDIRADFDPPLPALVQQ